MTLIKPDVCYYDKELKVSRLQFLKNPEMSGMYVVKGAVCFPKVIDFSSGRTEGYILTAGQRVIDGGSANGRIFIFEEERFITVDHVLGENSIIEFKGISSFLNESCLKYACKSYFYSQGHEVFKKYQRQIRHSPMINPKPGMKETPLMHEDLTEAMATVFEIAKVGKLKFKTGGGCNKAMDKVLMQNPEDTGYTPAAYAMMCLVNGLLRFPYRIRKTESKEPMIPKYLYDFERR